jgi:hypothetical protein
MKFIDHIIENQLEKAKEELFAHLNSIATKFLGEAKNYVVEDMLEEGNTNIIKQGRIQKIRRRIRRNAKGRIVVQKNRKRSGIKGYRIKGNRVVRISATTRIKKARLLKRSWKTTRRAKLRRSLLKRKLSMRRRSAMGL